GADEHKVQWLSASGDERFIPLFREILASSARLDGSFFDGHRQSGGGFSAKFFERLGIADGARVPADLAPHVAQGLQKSVEETVIGLAGEGANPCLAGGLFFNPLLVQALERGGRWKQVFVQAPAGIRRAWLGVVVPI